MNINEINGDWKEQTRQRELAHWKNKFKRSVRLCKAILAEIDTITYIKEKLAVQDAVGAQEAWLELDLEIQELLITAPTYGGPFTTKERSEITRLWRNT
jgi:hypothetical protein